MRASLLRHGFGRTRPTRHILTLHAGQVANTLHLLHCDRFLALAALRLVVVVIVVTTAVLVVLVVVLVDIEALEEHVAVDGAGDTRAAQVEVAELVATVVALLGENDRLQAALTSEAGLSGRLSDTALDVLPELAVTLG